MHNERVVNWQEDDFLRNFVSLRFANSSLNKNRAGCGLIWTYLYLVATGERLAGGEDGKTGVFFQYLLNTEKQINQIFVF